MSSWVRNLVLVATGLVVIAVCVALFARFGLSQAPAGAPTADSSKIASDGTAYITRIVPVPSTISPQAKKFISRPLSDAAAPARSVAEDRAATDKWQAGAGELSQKMYAATVTSSTVAGVPVRVIVPPVITPGNQDRVLINLHGGGFRVDSGSLTETIPIAHLTGMKVVSVLYRMAPEHAFPAAVDDAIAVYRDMLKTYKPNHVAIYGTSAGAVLTAEVTARLKQLGMPLPGATGIFSGTGDLSQPGDSQSIYSLDGLSGHLSPPTRAPGMRDYSGRTDLKDPVLSPFYADLKGFPPTLFITSTRDLLLSGTTILHRAYLRAGVDAQLVVFEALPHAFWNDPELPEAQEADAIMAKFFAQQLGR